MKVLIIGTTGMLGYSLFRNLYDYSHLEVFGTVRSIAGKEPFFEDCKENLLAGVGINNIESVIEKIKPDIAVNCIGLIKQKNQSKQHIGAVSINSLLPHQIANSCEKNDCKLVHFSTDCVFSGSKGKYKESDFPDAQDLYGKSKNLGEVDYAPHLTLRTSIIGHELVSDLSLIDWFLSQKGRVNGFSKAIFSGLPTCVIAEILADKIFPNRELTGLYHLGVDPIDKFGLLSLVSKIYNKDIEIIKSTDFVIDRSLNSELLRKEIKLETPNWEALIIQMNRDYIKRYKGRTCKN